MADILLLAAAAGAMAGAALLALMWMMGSLLQSQSIKTHVHLEIDEFVMSLILVLICLAIVGGRDAILQPLAGTSTPDAAVSAELAIIEGKLFNATVALGKNNMRIGKMVGYNFNYQIPMVLPTAYTRGSSPSAGAGPIVSSLITGSDGLWMTALLVRTEYIFYLFLSRFASLAYILPLGMALRFIAPFRKIGGFLIGVGLGAYLVFPAAILFGAALNGALMPTGTMHMVQEPGDLPQNSVICSPVISTLASIGEIVGPTGICSLLPWFPGTPSIPAPIGVGVPGCSYWLSLIWWGLKFYFDVSMAQALPSSAIVVSPNELITNYYTPLVQQSLPFAMQTALASIALVLVHVIPLVLITKNLVEFFSSEGQIYGLSKII